MLYIKKPDDWYLVSKLQVVKYGGGSLLHHYKGSLIRALQAIYPQHLWHPYQFDHPHHVPKGKYSFSKDQYLLFQTLRGVS